MYDGAKWVLKGASLLLVVVVGITFLGGIGKNSDYWVAAPWVFMMAFGFWISIASIALLTMAFSVPKGQKLPSSLNSARRGEWLISSYLLALGGLTTTNGWYYISKIPGGIAPSLVKPTVLIVAEIVLAVFGAWCVFFRYSWAKYVCLALAVLLFLRSEVWLKFSQFSTSMFGLWFQVGINSFSTLLVLACFVYLHRKIAVR